MRRWIAVLVALLVVGATVGGSRRAVAQAGENPFADLGLAEIAVTITEDAFEGVPSELDAGRYVLAVTNEVEPAAEGPLETSGVAFLEVPADIGTDALLEEFAPAPVGGAPEAEDDGTAEEGADAEGSPAAEEGGPDAPPAFYYETGLAGGTYAFPGETAYAVIELTAGEWIAWAEFPGAPQAPVPVEVTGDAPAAQPALEADVVIEMSDHAFSYDPPLAAGPQVVELVNVGEQPHFIFLGGVPDGTTVEDFLALAEAFGNPEATPTALAFEDVTEAFSTGDQSAGTTTWHPVDLEAGTYVAACFVTDPETGMPHVMLGMVDVFEVE